MKNIIGNSCASAFITKNFEKSAFINPFCYNIIDFRSMYNLIKNFDNINWLNFQLIREDNNTCSIIIDNLVKVNYAHYKFDANIDKQVKETDEGTDFISKHIDEFIKDKYVERITRMLKLKYPPIFLIASRFTVPGINTYTAEEIKTLMELDTPYIIIAATQFNIDFEIKPAKFQNREIIKLPKQGITSNGFSLSNYIVSQSKILKYRR